jgi:hypothetical protein
MRWGNRPLMLRGCLLTVHRPTRPPNQYCYDECRYGPIHLHDSENVLQTCLTESGSELTKREHLEPGDGRNQSEEFRRGERPTCPAGFRSLWLALLGQHCGQEQANLSQIILERTELADWPGQDMRNQSTKVPSSRTFEGTGTFEDGAINSGNSLLLDTMMIIRSPPESQCRSYIR